MQPRETRKPRKVTWACQGEAAVDQVLASQVCDAIAAVLAGFAPRARCRVTFQLSPGDPRRVEFTVSEGRP